MSTGQNGTLTLDIGTRLAIDRTRMAYERTLMAWVRTAVSLISFGFTIYKFFQFELQKQPDAPARLLGPREFALVMISIGLVALLLSTIQHRRSMRQMRAEFGQKMPLSTAMVVAVLFAGLGFAALVAVTLRQ